MSESLKKTPLHDIHLGLGARMTAFAGYDMPIQYSGIINEHMAVREVTGIFDVSHMGEVVIRGSKALDYVQRLVTNDVSKLVDGKALYTVMCRPDGGIIDDLLVYRLSQDEYMLVVNAANVEKDVAWMREQSMQGADVVDRSEEIALIALQGPRAYEIAKRASGKDISTLKFYHFERPDDFLGHTNVILSATGYTGEQGLEIYCPPSAAPSIWSALMDAGESDGLLPCGLGARDTLRLEAGFSLYGNDLTEDTNPYESGLGWLVKLDAGDFIGRDALADVKAEGPTRKLIGFVLQERGIPRPGLEIVDAEGASIGSVTSGTQSPILKQGIGLGYVPNDSSFTAAGAEIGIQSRGKTLPAIVTRPPFHKK